MLETKLNEVSEVLKIKDFIEGNLIILLLFTNSPAIVGLLEREI